MQIDFHHGVTYVVARLSGLSDDEAQIVAHCAQYIDDATNSGPITFDNGAIFERDSSAHKMLDYRNMDALADHKAWVPFHFLPGNDGKKAGENPDATFLEKIVCRPNSPIAQDMVRVCIEEKDKAYGLHRLGVTLHVYADTWAHQGFAGVIDQVNDISEIQDENDNEGTGLFDRLKDYFSDQFDESASKLVGDKFPLGHGAALSYPDRPYLHWSYVDYNGNKVKRDNTADFMEAAENMCQVVRRFILGNPNADVPGLPPADREKILKLLQTIKSEDGEERHESWLKHIREGHFSFGKVNLEYKVSVAGSWKRRALEINEELSEAEEQNRTLPYPPTFLKSNWKLFFDALAAHRFVLMHEILPKYGICAV